MACHLAGVHDRGRDLRHRVRRGPRAGCCAGCCTDHDEFRGEVIFTFDGDEAGQKAALRAFEGDQKFAGQTYVAVEPDGLDPCDLRLQQGDAAVRELVARRVPLYRFVLGNVVSRYDLDRADGRIDALREAAKLVSSDPRPVQGRARSPASSPAWSASTSTRPARRYAAPRTGRPDDRRPRPRRRRRRRPPSRSVPPRRRCPTCATRGSPSSARRSSSSSSTREAVGRMAKDVDGDDFTHPAYRAVWEAVAAARRPGRRARRRGVGRQAARQRRPTRRVRAGAVRAGRRAAAVQQGARPRRTPPRTSSGCRSSPRCAGSPTSSRGSSAPTRSSTPTEYNRMFGELVALEQHRRTLREQAIGGDA